MTWGVGGGLRRSGDPNIGQTWKLVQNITTLILVNLAKKLLVWPNLVLAKVGLAKVGLAKVGHSRLEEVLEIEILEVLSARTDFCHISDVSLENAEEVKVRRRQTRFTRWSRQHLRRFQEPMGMTPPQRDAQP